MSKQQDANVTAPGPLPELLHLENGDWLDPLTIFSVRVLKTIKGSAFPGESSAEIPMRVAIDYRPTGGHSEHYCVALIYFPEDDRGNSRAWSYRDLIARKVNEARTGRKFGEE